LITLKELRWSNAFSYGANNKIVLDNAPLTQLVGKNGHGKSSIALIIEEVLYNKNSKGIKKSDILNRYCKEKTYSIELDLVKDGVPYTVKTNRGTTQSTVKLFRDGLDISSHTATQTYKSIEELIGIDHRAFSQIVYQSHASSLEFLTSTDSVRKKFLIDLLDLGIYTKAGEVFKEISTELNKEIAACQAKVNTVSSWLNKYIDIDLTPKALTPEPELDPQLEQTFQSKLPSLNLPSYNSPNPFVKIPEPGEHIDYGDLELTFRVDENLKNYLEIHNWIRALGKPKDFSEYRALSQNKNYTGDGIRSDISLTILSSAKNANYEIVFTDAYPYELSKLTFDTTDQTVDYIEASATFKYVLFEIKDI